MCSLVSVSYTHLDVYKRQIQADETPVLVNHDGRKAGSKSWMWVYRSGHLYQDRQIVPVSYTHLDVYKRQLFVSLDISIQPRYRPVNSRIRQ